MNPDVCPTCGRNWPERAGRICSLCGVKIGLHHKFRFIGSRCQHRDCNDPTLLKLATELQSSRNRQTELLTEDDNA